MNAGRSLRHGVRPYLRDRVADAEDRIRRHLRDDLSLNSYFLVSSSWLGQVLGIAFWALAAKFYDTASLGLSIAAVSAASLVSMIARMGLDSSVIRYMHRTPDRHGMINTSLTVNAAGSFVLALVFLATIHFWSPKLVSIRGDALFAIMFVGFCVIQSMQAMLRSIFIGFRANKFVNSQTLIVSATKIPLAAALAGLASIGIILSWAISMALAVVVGVWYSLRRLDPTYRFRLQVHREGLHLSKAFSAANYVATVFQLGAPMVMPIVILNMLTPEHSAFFYVTYTLVGALRILPESFSTSLFAEGSFQADRFRARLRHSLGLSLGLMLPMVGGMVVLGHVLLTLLGEEYLDAAYGTLILLTVSTIFSGITLFYSNYLKIALRNVELVFLTVTRTVLLFAIAVTLLPTHGILGVGIAYLIARGSFAVYSGIQLLRLLRHGAKPAEPAA